MLGSQIINKPKPKVELSEEEEAKQSVSATFVPTFLFSRTYLTQMSDFDQYQIPA